MADRPTASTITDDQLEELYAELDHYVLREVDRTDGEQDPRLTPNGVLHMLASVGRRRTEQRDRARTVAVALENENARLEAETEEHRQAHEQETANTAREIGRAQRAEQQLAAVRALHQPADRAGETVCAHCTGTNTPGLARRLVTWPCPTLAALDAARQPDTSEQAGAVDWQTIARRRERELKQEGERRNRAEAQLVQQCDRIADRIVQAYPDDFGAGVIADHIRGLTAWPDEDAAPSR